LADAGIMTPKHAAKSLARFGAKHGELGFSQFLIPQVPGARNSRRARGVTESIVRSKKYMAPLAVFQPWVAAGTTAAYLASGRFNPSRLPHSICDGGGLAACLPATESALPED